MTHETRDNEIQFVDQTIRDGQQSLWGHLMTTDMILPIAPVMDQVGYRIIAVPGGRGGVVARRSLRENILERYQLLSQTITKTPLRSSFTTWSAFNFDVEPLAPIELLIRRLVANGIKSFWVCDYQLVMDKLAYLVKVAKEEGAEVVVSLMYALSPIHTDELYAKKTRLLANMGGVDGIQVEDTGGVLTPERTKTLLPAIQRESRGIPIELHLHCNTGLAAVCYAEAIQLGVRVLHTAAYPLANDTSLPSVENTISNARHLGYPVNINEEALKVVSDHFRKSADEHGLRIGAPQEYDIFHYKHQVPGGMMGTMKNQLAELGIVDRLNEVIKEMAQIREEFGYPVMATPYSQIVGAQAVFNITSGQRYKIVPDEVIKYALEAYGKPEGTMDQNIKYKILSSPKAKNLMNWKPAEITVDDLRKLEPGLSDDELLLSIANPEGEFKEKLKALYGKR